MKQFINITDSSFVLIITGCISPLHNQRYLFLKDEKERLKQYLECIDYYVRNTKIKNIVFCENSGFFFDKVDDLLKSATVLGVKMEWLSFRGDMELVAKYSTKGIGEDEILDYVFTNSKLVKDARSFSKVTGRLILLNIDKLLECAQYETNYFYRDIYSNGLNLDTRFYVMDVNSYKYHLRRCYSIVKDYDLSLERVYRVLLKRKYKTLPLYPRFRGISGGVGVDYGKESSTKLFLIDLLCKWNLYDNLASLLVLIFKIRRKIKSFLK